MKAGGGGSSQLPIGFGELPTPAEHRPGAIPCRRATSDTEVVVRAASSTIARFSSPTTAAACRP